jgi:hypothetical protein
VPGRRYNCACGKKRYRDEESATAAAARDEQAYGETVTVYRCPGGLAWHLTTRGFVGEALPSIGRRLAWELLGHDGVDLDDFRTRVLRPPAGPGSRRWHRAETCARRLTDLGLARRAGPDGPLRAADPDGLARVVRIGLDAYAAEAGNHPDGDDR